MGDKVTKRVNLICAPLILCVTAWLSFLLSRVQSWTPSWWQSKGQKYSETIKTWSSRKKYRILDFLCTQVILGKEQTSTEVSITPHVGTPLNAKYFPSSLLPRRDPPLIQHSEASMEFPCGLGPHCMSFLLQTSLSESFLLKSIFIYPFSNCLSSSHAAYFPLVRGTKKLCWCLPSNHISFPLKLQLSLPPSSTGTGSSGQRERELRCSWHSSEQYHWESHSPGEP